MAYEIKTLSLCGRSTDGCVSRVERVGSRVREVFVDTCGGFASVGDGPDDEGLAAFDVAGGKDPGDVRLLVCIDCDEAFRVQGQIELRN